MHPFNIHEKASPMLVGAMNEIGIEAARQSVFF
jgi:hypothetical protein